MCVCVCVCVCACDVHVYVSVCACVCACACACVLNETADLDVKQSHPLKRACCGQSPPLMFVCLVADVSKCKIMYTCTTQLPNTVFHDSAVMVVVINLYIQNQSHYHYMY